MITQCHLVFIHLEIKLGSPILWHLQPSSLAYGEQLPELFENVGLLYINAFVNTLVKETSSGPYQEEWLEVAKQIAHCSFIPMSSP